MWDLVFVPIFEALDRFGGAPVVWESLRADGGGRGCLGCGSGFRL